MEDERSEVVYDIGYGYGNPCRYLQETFRGILKCLGFENQEEGEGKETHGGGGGGGGGRGGDDPPTTSPSGDPPVMDPTNEPISSTGMARRRAPARGPVTSGGGGQTN